MHSFGIILFCFRQHRITVFILTFSSSGILKTAELHVWKLDMFPSSGEEGDSTLLGPLERANLSHWTTHVNITTAI
jgi:hypothetical protein